MNNTKWADKLQKIYEQAESYINEKNEAEVYTCYTEMFDILEPIMKSVISKEFFRRGTSYTKEDMEDLLQELKFALARFAVYNYRKSDDCKIYYESIAKNTDIKEIQNRNFMTYCIKILSLTAKDCTKKGQKIYWNETALSYINDDGDEVLKIENTKSAEDSMRDVNTRELCVTLTNYMLDEIFNSHQSPQRLLALCYVRYAAILFMGEHKGSQKWAYGYMHKTVGRLSDIFERMVRNQYGRKDICWNRTYMNKLNELYCCRDGKEELLTDILYTQEFTETNVRVWNDRVGDAINKSAIQRMMSEGEGELLAALREYKKARKILDKIEEVR